MSQKLNESNISECQAKFNLSYHVPFAYSCQQMIGFEGKDVLEVGGSLPKEFVLDYLNVKSWSALEAPDFEVYLDRVASAAEGSKLGKVDYSAFGFTERELSNYNFFAGYIEELPPAYYQKYDLIFSIAAFEHIHKFPLALEKMFLALKPGGQLFSIFTPIWSAHDGHHLPPITEPNQGKTFNFQNSPIPPWGHLLMRPPELCRYLYQHTDKETADAITHYVYNSPHINRFFTEDYVEFINQSSFLVKRLEPIGLITIENNTQQTLEKLYPGRTQFANNGILAVLEKPENKKKENISEKSITSLSEQRKTQLKNDHNPSLAQTKNQVYNHKPVQVSSEFSGSPMQSLSVCMIVQNAEKTLEIALESLDGVYDELIVVDGGSTDSTCEIALRYGAKVINSPWTGNFSDQRNVSLKEVKTDWVFIIDADEFIDRKTLEFLRYVKANGTELDTDYFLITRKWISPFSKKYYVNSQPHFPDWQCRLYKYDKAIFYSGQIHCVIHGLKQQGISSMELGVYHLDLLVKSESQRQKKVQIYMKDNPRDGMPHYYIPDIMQLSLQEWNHQDLLPEVPKLLNAMPMKCKVCESDSHHFAQGKVMGKYDVDYFQCSNCGFVQTEEPYWLDEAYSQPIASSDVGLAFRNLSFSQITQNLLFNFFNHQARFLDYGGGYGLFVRLMRDAGFDFYWLDKFCQNIFAQGFEIDAATNNQFELVTAFEVFEHLVHPIDELENLLKTSRNILFSTELLPESNPKPDEWWYYVLHEGQHVSLYTAKALSIIAAKFNLNFYSNGSSLHLLTEKELPDDLFQQLAKGELAAVNKVSLLQNDFLKAVSKITHIQQEAKIQPAEIEEDGDSQSGLKILVDGVFFQMYQTGIARVWRSLLEEWAENGFAKYIIVLDRVGTSPKIPGIAYCPVPAYDYQKTDSDREMLQQVCDELDADLFISTYYTTPLSTPSVFIAYDMTPEVFETNLEEPMWREKHYGIRHASAYITISHNTASDLLKFFPDIAPELVTVAHCGVPKNLSPASPEEIESFKIKYNLSKPYFMMVGAAGGHKNAPLFLQAFAQLPNQTEFDIVCTAHSALTKDEFEPYTSGSTVHKLPLSDEELKAAFSGAVALVYPSQYEGFGLPILEAMACGCPVITCPNASIPEVAGEAALYVQDDDVEEMAIALVNIQKPEVREALIAAGIEQAKKFSWSKMAKTVTSVFIKVFEQKESMLIRQENSKNLLPERDYISPDFAIVLPDECFPNMIVGDTELQPWPYLRREVSHNWYVDKRHPTVGFLSRDEAHILYNTALKFKGKKALEIGCWLGWSACHLALAGVKLEIVDPLLARPDFYESVSNSLQAAGVLDSIHLVAGYSPQAVEELAAQLQTKWSLIFIDGNHEAPGPLNDAIICEQLAAQDALILFHDLAAPDVAQGLDYFKQKGWQTMVYQTMQIMGVAWRGNVEPVIHLPDPKVNWVLPAHLQNYTVSGMSNQSLDREVAVRQVHEMMQQAVALLNSNKPVEAMRIAEQAASLNINVPGMHYLRSICLGNVGRHKEALAAAKAELAIDPTHRQAQEQVESLTKAILRSPIKIPTQQRSWNTTLARENMLSIQNATMNYSYRGVPMIKNPFDFALYPVLIWNLKPRTIIEIGSKDGGSAVWLGDMLNNFGIEGHIYSIDIVEVTSVQHPRVTYMEGNGRALQEILTPGFINSLPRPLLVIEDADHSYETSKHVLEFFHPYLKLEEYIVIEEGIISDLVQDASYNIGPHKALKEFLSEHEDEYEIDSTYCDYFGYNMTWCTNGFLKKVKESSSLGEPFLNKLFHYVEEYQPVSQVGSSVDLSGDRQKLTQLIQKGKECFVKGEIEAAIATFTQALEVNQNSLIAHNYLTSLYWQVGDVQQSLQHHIQAQFRNIAFDNTLTDEFQEILSVIRPYTLLSEARLFSLYSLARQICLDDIPGNFVECGSYKGGSAALLAVVIKRYSLRPRLVYAFDTFEGMPEPTEADKHNGIPANLTDWGARTLKAPLTDNLDVICQSLDVGDIVISVKGLFAQTLPESKSEIGSIALLHADGDWYESTMDIFNNIYDRVVPKGFVQIDDYGHWEGCKKAIHEFERGCGQSFALRVIDYTGVWFQKEDSVHQDCNHWRTFWHLAQASEKLGNIELAKKAAQAVLKIVPKLVKAENLLNRDRSQLELVVSPEVSLSAELDDFLNNLRLREINIILFPDWQQPEESLCLELEAVMTTLLAHKEPSKITALLDTSNISEEDANLVLSSVIMNILMQEDLDETDVPEVSLLGTLSEMQWKALLPRIHYRVVLENENQQAVAQAGAASLPSLKATNLSIG
jgi:cephalosporin hydroxylase/glycosyltransferase involved in cell wall biosynthesis/SAM-dependent methyltransferase